MSPSLHVSMFLHCSFLLLSFHLSNSAFSSSVQPFCHDHERSSLLQFKKSFIVHNLASSSCLFANQNLASWTENDHFEDNNCCLWHGVECDHRTGHVIALDLSMSCLYGSINSNSTLFELLHLQSFNLAQNNLNFSAIPSAFGQLLRLTNLNLSNSMLSGQIPLELSQLHKLTSIDLSYNPKLKVKSQDFGSLIGNFSNLEKLHLNQVNLSSEVPQVLSNLTSLMSLSLDECGLRGEFPYTIFKLPYLQNLSLMYNDNLTGELPEFQSSSPLEELRLSGTNFSGVLPRTIGNLGSLRIFSIWYCNFHGPIPFSLGNLTQLRHLNFGFNSFTGQFPLWVTNLTKLETLKLPFNNLSGALPSSFETLIPTHLTTLFLQSNNFNGSIPSQFMNKSQITYLDLSYNTLQGPIPSALFELNNLSFLDLSFNNLSGVVDIDRFLQLQNLTTLHLSENRLSLHTDQWNSSYSIDNDIAHVPKFKELGLSSCNLGKFPNFIRYQDELEWLELAHNNIGGPIPSWVWNISTHTLLFLNLSANSLTGFDQSPPVFSFSRLAILDLGSNHLHGSLPYPSPSITFFSTSNNSLSGKILPLICKMSPLVILDLSENKLSGTIPPCLTNSSHLAILNLRGNKFGGSLPQTWTEKSQLKMISLSNNNLKGQLPRSLFKCALLECIDVSQNHIKDTFPYWLSNLSNLKVLLLRSNLFHGEIKSLELVNSSFPNLSIIDLSSNSFTGNLPSHLFLNWNPLRILTVDHLSYLQFSFSFELSSDNVTKMMWYVNYAYSMTIADKGLVRKYEKIESLFTAIDFSKNKFGGSIPGCIGRLEGLHLLNLSGNSLVGQIPPSIANLTELESLDLSCNNLSGKIPQELSELTFLEVFNVSHNSLEGPIPRGTQFDTFEESSFCGNSGLCGTPLSRRCGYVEVWSAPAPPSSSGYDYEEEEEECSESLLRCYWKVVLVGYGCGVVIGVCIGNLMFKRMHGCFMRILGWRKHKFN